MATPHDDFPRAELSATADGRLTIPEQVWRAAGIGPGQILAVYADAGRIVLEERGRLLARIQDEAIAAAGHTGGSAVEDLLADRRTAAAREDAERLGPLA